MVQDTIAAAGNVRRILKAHSKQIDGELIDYLGGMVVEDDSPMDDMIETISSFLLSGGAADDDDEANSIAREIYETCCIQEDSLESNGDGNPDADSALARPISLGCALESGKDAISDTIGAQKVARASEIAATALNAFTQTSFASSKDLSKLEKRRKNEEKKERERMEAAMKLATVSLGSANMSSSENNPGISGGLGVVDVSLQYINLFVGGKELIKDAELLICGGRRYGLIGRNGTGKSSFLRLISAREVHGIPKGLSIMHIEQEIMGDDTRVIDAVLSVDKERLELLEAEKSLLNQAQSGNGKDQDDSVGNKLNAIYKRLTEIDADSAESRASEILAGLSFTPQMQTRPTSEFSGGWRMRVALAQALFAQPDLLLLDEPTNHLDLHAALWLQDHLLKWKGTLILVSHARDFLNSVATDIIHLHDQHLTMYHGDYDNFESARAEKIKEAKKQQEASDRKKKHVQEFIDKFRYNAKRASLVQSRIKKLQRMTESENFDIISEDPDYHFNFPDPGEGVGGSSLIGFDNVDFGYPGGKLLFRELNFGITMETRVAIVGENGAGKTTLLKLISGDLDCVKGKIERSSKIRISIFSQHHVDGLDLSKTALRYMLDTYVGTTEQQMRSHLASFGINSELAAQPMYTLSGGQKSRVAFSKITWSKPHLLLLDEPSNHLDLDSIEALIQGLTLFQGGILMVSHDQYLIEGTVDELWACKGGRIIPFQGSFEDYKKMIH